MPIIVDSRGFGEKAIGNIVKGKGLPVEVKVLESADYVIGNIGMERKTLDDLLGSISKGYKNGTRRLWEQIRILKETYKHPILIFEAKKIPKDVSLKVEAILIGVECGWSIPVWRTSGIYDTADFLAKIYKKYGEGHRKSRILPPVVKKSLSPERVKWCMLQTIEGIGPSTASEILSLLPNIFGTVYYENHFYKQMLQVKRLKKHTRDILARVIGLNPDIFPDNQK